MNARQYTYNLAIKFEEISNKYAARQAILNDRISVSYSQLNKKSNRLARYLLEYITVSSSIPILYIPAVQQELSYCLIIACLKAGICYAFYDPDSPFDRLKKMFDRCQPDLIITDGVETCLATEVISEQYNAIASITIEKESTNLSEDNLMTTANVIGTTPAYVMFTSGSTGEPKGVVISHEKLLNFIDWCIDSFKFTPKDVLTNINPLFFDNSVFDFYAAIFSGACLVPITKAQAQFPQTTFEILEKYQCTSWYSVPSLLIYYQNLKSFSQKKLFNLKRIIFGGEGFPLIQLKPLYEQYSETISFFNVYGPTECTCMCSYYRIQPHDFQSDFLYPPLGAIAKNFSYLILDEAGQPVAEGAAGELCLLGPNVSEGYYNDIERTVVSFVQNPQHSHYREIMYKTGDLVRFDPETLKLHILGRKDNQIKYMGYRIELEEIENILMSFSEINKAVVLFNKNDKGIKFVAILEPNHFFELRQFKIVIKTKLPTYMIPREFILVDQVPYNSNGKVDRKLLHTQYIISAQGII